MENSLKEMGMPDHLTYLLRYAGQEASVRTRHGKSDWLQIGKGVHQAYCLCILPPCLLFNLFAEYIIRNARKAMKKLNSSLNRHIYLPTKIHIVKAMFFPVVMYGRESCTIKKAECQRIDAFKLWCWRRLLRVPWTARRSTLNIHWKD